MERGYIYQGLLPAVIHRTIRQDEGFDNRSYDQQVSILLEETKASVAEIEKALSDSPAFQWVKGKHIQLAQHEQRVVKAS